MSNKQRRHTRSVRISEHIIEQVRELAYGHQRSLSGEIDHALEEYIRRQPSRKRPNSKEDR
jgi:hypothetical protein